MFSIIIPLFNKANFIEDTLQSVFNQTYAGYEVILVDDGSTDNSLEVISQIKDKRLRVYSKINGGVSSARNFGISKASKEYIVFLDADDLWMPNFLEIILNLIRLYKEARMFCCTFKYKGKKDSKEYKYLNLSNKNNKETILIANYCKARIEGRILCCSSATCIKKDILKEVGLFREGIQSAEDLDMWLRVGLKYKIAFSYKVGAIYLQETENNIMKNNVPISKRFPCWEWYNYKSSDKKSLFELTNNAIIGLSNLLLKEGDIDNSKFVLSKLHFKTLNLKGVIKYLILVFITTFSRLSKIRSKYLEIIIILLILIKYPHL